MGNTAGKLSEKATRNPPGRTPEISYGRAILQPAIYNLSTVARQGPEKQPEASGNILGELHGEHRRETVGESHPKPAGKDAGDHREDAGKPPKLPPGKPLFCVTPHPRGGKACAHISICQRTSLSISIHPHPITHRQSTLVTPLMGLGCVESEPTALAVGTAATLLVGWGCVCMEPKRPVPKTPQAASPCSWACRRQLLPPPQPERKEAPKPPCSWGLGASTQRQRHWLAALPPPCL